MNCKICGKKIKYCPYCGALLAETTTMHAECSASAQSCNDVMSMDQSALPIAAVGDDVVGMDSVPTSQVPVSPEQAAVTADVQDADDVVRYYREFVQQQREAGLTEVDIKPLADQLLALLKQKLQSKLKFSTKSRFGVLQAEDDFIETDEYSIVLKGCPNRESLIYRLDQVLVRDYKAIRWTVEKMPCVAIYKGNVQDMIPVIRAFREEQAMITIMPGNLLDDDTLSIEQIFPDFGSLGPKVKSLLRGVPLRLWEGETIRGVLLARHHDKESGALVITDQGIYFVDKVLESMDYRWLAIPYYRLGVAQCAKDAKTHRLVLPYREGTREEVFHISDVQKFNQAYETIKKAMADGWYQLKIKTVCVGCGYTNMHDIDTFDDDKQCSHCGQLLCMKLMVRKNAATMVES